MFGYSPLYTYKPPANPAAAPVQPRVFAAHNVIDGPDTVFPFPVSLGVVKASDAASARAAVRRLKELGNDFIKVYSTLPKDAFFAALDEAQKLGMWCGGHVPHAVRVGDASDAGYHTVEHLGGVIFQCSKYEERIRAGLLDLHLLVKPGEKWNDDDLSAWKADRVTGWKEQAEAHKSFDPAKADALFRKFVKNGTWHVPTLVTARALARMGDRDAIGPELPKGLPDQLQYFWKREFTEDGGVRLPNLKLRATREDLLKRAALLKGDIELVRKMHAAGVGMLAGSDTPTPLVVPGVSLHEELELLVEAGLTPADALRAATLNPALCLGRRQDLGTVEVGKLADMVLLSADPLADIRNTRAIVAVVIGGRIAER
jgi:hypothetical protein